MNSTTEQAIDSEATCDCPPINEAWFWCLMIFITAFSFWIISKIIFSMTPNVQYSYEIIHALSVETEPAVRTYLEKEKARLRDEGVGCFVYWGNDIFVGREERIEKEEGRIRRRIRNRDLQERHYRYEWIREETERLRRIQERETLPDYSEARPSVEDERPLCLQSHDPRSEIEMRAMAYGPQNDGHPIEPPSQYQYEDVPYSCTTFDV